MGSRNIFSPHVLCLCATPLVMTDLAPETYVHLQYFSGAFDLRRARRNATAESFKYTIDYEAQAWEGEVQCAMNHHGSSIPFPIYPVAESKTAFLFNDRFVVNKPPHPRQDHRTRLFSTSNSYPEMIPGSGRPWRKWRLWRTNTKTSSATTTKKCSNYQTEQWYLVFLGRYKLVSHHEKGISRARPNVKERLLLLCLWLLLLMAAK